MVKNLPVTWETWVRSLGLKDPMEKGTGLPTPVFWPRKFHRQRSLAGYIQSMGSHRVGHDWVPFTLLTTLKFGETMFTKHLAFNLAQSRQLTTRRFLPLLADEKIQCQQEVLLESRCCPSPLTVCLGLGDTQHKDRSGALPTPTLLFSLLESPALPPVGAALWPLCGFAPFQHMLFPLSGISFPLFFLMSLVSFFFFFCHLKSIISINNHLFIPEFLTPLSESDSHSVMSNSSQPHGL